MSTSTSLVDPCNPSLDRLLGQIPPRVARLLDASLAGHALEVEGAIELLTVTGRELQALTVTADALRQQQVGEVITFVACRNIQFTNICYVGCSFCAFAHHGDSPSAYRMSTQTVVEKAGEALEAGCTEVCMQGGLHPAMALDDYLDLVSSIKTRYPQLHVHAFSPFEIQYMARRSKCTEQEALRALKQAGLSSIPGTAAEILDTDVRRILTKNKLSAEAWIRIVKTAHAEGLFSTSTMMYGHVDEPRHQAEHMALLRSIQEETGGFTEFVPLGFIHEQTRLYASGVARPGPTALDELRVHAVARLMLGSTLRNIQVSWVKMGVRQAQMCLMGGANDFGGTLMNESISNSAGSKHGQAMSSEEFVAHIRALGRVPARRSTSYAVLETFSPS